VTRATKPKAAKRGDRLTHEIETLLRPIMGRSAEKADLLVEHMAKTHDRDVDYTPRGLTDAVRRLRAAKFSEAQIRAGAKGLLAELGALYSKRETVV
jgi:hypothetical protein